MTPPRHGLRRTHPGGIVEVRTGGGRPSPIVIASGVVIAAVLVAAGWVVLRDRRESSEPPDRGTSTAASMPHAADASTGQRAPRSSSPPAAAVGDVPRGPAAVPPSDAATSARAASHSTTSPADSPRAHGGPASESAPPAEAAAEESSGLAAFPPLGTKPIQRGIIVPDEYELPPGYVRHYQATDDGQMLAPILRFHPDHAPQRDDGNSVPIPSGRVVPPELAPAGMPIDFLEPPPPVSPEQR